MDDVRFIVICSFKEQHLRRFVDRLWAATHIYFVNLLQFYSVYYYKLVVEFWCDDPQSSLHHTKGEKSLGLFMMFG